MNGRTLSQNPRKRGKSHHHHYRNSYLEFFLFVVAQTGYSNATNSAFLCFLFSFSVLFLVLVFVCFCFGAVSASLWWCAWQRQTLPESVAVAGHRYQTSDILHCRTTLSDGGSGPGRQGVAAHGTAWQSRLNEEKKISSTD